MAHFSVHVSTVRRSIGQNAIASAAYNSRSKLTLNVTDKETNITVPLTWDYGKKGGLAFSRIYVPAHAPDWVFNRETLWNKCEQMENRCDAVPAGKVMIALPNEFTLEQNITLLEEITNELVELGMVVDCNIHNDNKNNPHAHILHTTRELIENRYGEIDFSPKKNRDWQGGKWVCFVRELAADYINKHYKQNGFDARVTHKSYKEMGVDIEPSVHEGPARNIKNAELVELNLQIAAANAEKIKANPTIILDILGMNNPVFTKEQIATELEKRLHAGIDFNKIDDIESMQSELSATFTILYKKILTCPEISQIIEEDLKGRTLYTTTKRLELEERFTDTVQLLNERKNHVLAISDSDLDHLSLGEQIVKKGKDITRDIVTKINDKTGLEFNTPKHDISLSPEQRRVVVNILNGSDISVLEGIPGAGKTTVMREIVRQYKKAGYTVIGVTPSSAASLELAKATGIECHNASKWRHIWLTKQKKKFELMLKGDYYKEDLYKNNKNNLNKKYVMLVDESSMGELANMDYLYNEVKIAKAKIIPIGDSNQIAPVGWAGAFTKTISICGSERLEESRRQQNPLHIEATKLLSQYKVRDALDIYWKNGNIKVAKNQAEAVSMAVHNFITAYIETAKHIEQDDLISIRAQAMMVLTNDTRSLLNGRVREQLKESGILKGKEQRVLVGSLIRDGKYEKQYLNLARGEQIVFTKNINHAGKSGIFNGELGTILKVYKPNKNALATIDILVHKASGKFERVLLDLNDLATNKYTGKYFHDGKLAIDYGYAVTSHKVQGASITKTIWGVEKGTGFENTNVLLTRHRKDIEIIVDKELLYDSYYESLGETAPAARNRFELNSADESAILKGGLAKIVSKRTNTSFAHDYRTMGQTKEDKIVKDYLDKSEETISALRKITAWQTKEQRKNGYKPNLWDHKEFWHEFKEIRQKRNQVARRITLEYSRFKDRLIQLNMNYATIEKHGNRVGPTVSEKVLVDQKDSRLYQQDSFKNLVQSISSGQTISVRKCHKALLEHIADTTIAIEDRVTNSKEQETLRQELTDAVEKEKHYRKELIPEYLNRIYRTDQNSQKEGDQVLKSYQQMVHEHGEEVATKMVVKNPKILGELKGYGLGRWVGFTGARKDAIALYQNLGRELRGFNRSGEMIKQYESEMKEANFGEKIFVLNEEIEHLRSLLPNDLDKELIEKIESELNKTASNDIDWRELQKSELFNAVIIGQYKDNKGNKDSIFENKDEQENVITENKEKKGSLTYTFKNSKQKTQNKNFAKPRLTFQQVKLGLTESVVTDIFYKYAPMLNSDGKLKKQGNLLSSSSLKMSLSSSNLGLWHKFSNGKGGDIFSFIEYANGCSKYEALQIVASHAGIVATETNHIASANNKNVDNQVTKEIVIDKNVWVAERIVPETAPTFNPKKHLTFIEKNGGKVTLTHAYKNQDNQLLGYVVRIEESEQKQVLPVAYCHNEKQNKSRWNLKGFSDNGTKPIYGLEQLTKHPTKEILIVEGEKTADMASKLFPDHVVISWMGGAQAIDKVDWSKLKNRAVTIWPDNDKPGIDAARNIVTHIDNHNGFTGLVNVVDTEKLELQKKWDLADKIPEGINIHNIVEHAGKGISNISNQLSLNQPKSQQYKLLSDSINMLVETNRISKDNYLSEKLYHNTLHAIAVSKNIDLEKITNYEEFSKNIQELQNIYQSLHRSYELNHLSTRPANSNHTSLSTKEQLAHDIIRNTSVLHMQTLNKIILAQTHIDHIKQTVDTEISKMQRFTDSDKKHTANNIYKAINSTKWQSELDKKNKEQAASINLRFKAKTIDEFLLHQNNPKAETHLEHIREHGLNETHILQSFRVSNGNGASVLAKLSEQITVNSNLIEKHNDIFTLAKNYNIEKNQNQLIQGSIDKDKTKIEAHCLNHVLEQFNEQKQESNNTKEIVSIIKKEDEFLSKTNISEPEQLDKNIQERIEIAKNGNSKPIIEDIEKNLLANIKQGIVADKELSKTLIKPEYDIKNISKDLHDLAATGRDKHFQLVGAELSILKTVYPDYDKDSLVSILKNKSEETKEEYINLQIAKHTKKYVDPIFATHTEAKNKATNFKEFLNAVEKEQKTFVNLYNNHQLAISELDKHNGNLKLSVSAHSAYELNLKNGGINGAIKEIEYAVKHDITTPDKIIKDYQKDGNLQSIHESLTHKCKDHKAQIETNNMASNKDISHEDETSKTQTIKTEKEFSM